MRRYLLDSPILTGYLKGRKVVTLVEPWLDQNQAATSILVFGEISEYNHNFPDFTRVPELDVMFLPRDVLKS
jgi:hypothetical protein